MEETMLNKSTFMPYQAFSYYEVLGNDESGLLISLHWEFISHHFCLKASSIYVQPLGISHSLYQIFRINPMLKADYIILRFHLTHCISKHITMHWFALGFLCLLFPWWPSFVENTMYIWKNVFSSIILMS